MRPRLLSPTSLLSGAFTFGLLFVQAGVARAVIPHLRELFETSPRLALTGILALVLFPGTLTFVVHRFGSRFLDSSAGIAGKSRVIESVWAAALVWLVTYSTSILVRLLYLIINPPKPDPDALSLGTEVMNVLEQLSPANTISIFAALWIGVSSIFFEIEKRARKA